MQGSEEEDLLFLFMSAESKAGTSNRKFRGRYCLLMSKCFCRMKQSSLEGTTNLSTSNLKLQDSVVGILSGTQIC